MRINKYRFYTGVYPRGLKSWIYQLFLWIIVIVISKILVLFIIYVFYTPLYFITFFILYFSWNDTIEKIIILVIAPLIQNLFVFYVNVSLEITHRITF